MDGETAGERRYLERVFQVDRHSEFVLATAFERLGVLGKALDLQVPQRADDGNGSNLQQQEANS